MYVHGRALRCLQTRMGVGFIRPRVLRCFRATSSHIPWPAGSAVSSGSADLSWVWSGVAPGWGTAWGMSFGWQMAEARESEPDYVSTVPFHWREQVTGPDPVTGRGRLFPLRTGYGQVPWQKVWI